MNTTHDDHGSEDLRSAEYVLGVLDADAQSAVEREMARNPRLADEVSWWQSRLFPLCEDLAEVVPAAYVWERVRAAVGFDAQQRRAEPRTVGFWNSLGLWRAIGIGASALAAACLVLVFATWPEPQPQLPVVVTQPPPPPPQQPPGAGLMVATIVQDSGVASWTATMDIDNARMVLVPVDPQPMDASHSPELWLIPPGEAPISLGVIANDEPSAMRLPANVLARFSGEAVLAVSLEPLGGSPTGAPTGAILAKGGIDAA